MKRPARKGGDVLRPSHIITTAVLALCCSFAAASAATAEVAPPPSSMAASQAEEYKDLRSVQVEQDPYVLNRDYGSPDAVDGGRDLAPATQAAPGVFTDSERKLVESPEVQAMVDRVIGEIRATPAVVAVEPPSSGFDWGDAGIGAAGMLALFSIAAGSALLIGGRRRRHGVKVATH
jgi:hypothetical protein